MNNTDITHRIHNLSNHLSCENKSLIQLFDKTFDDILASNKFNNIIRGFSDFIYQNDLYEDKEYTAFFWPLSTLEDKYKEVKFATCHHHCYLNLQNENLNLSICYDWSTLLHNQNYINKTYISDDIEIKFQKEIFNNFEEHFDSLHYKNDRPINKEIYDFIINNAFSFNNTKDFEEMLLLNQDSQVSHPSIKYMINDLLRFKEITEDNFVFEEKNTQKENFVSNLKNTFKKFF